MTRTRGRPCLHERLATLLPFVLIALSSGLVALSATPSAAQDLVRIGLPTKTYYPTIIAETALRQKLFEKEGIKAELTVYRGGAETFEALAAGAADVILNSASLVAAGIPKGVESKAVAGAALGYYGWYLMVPTNSKITKVSELEGKKVGITSAGSGSDLLARWTIADRKVNFTRVPLGGGGLVPNLLSGNVDAVVLYSPLSFKMMDEKLGRFLIDYGAAVPPHLTGAWIASGKILKEKPAVVQKTLNALYGGLHHLQTNREDGVKMVAEIDEIPEKIAALELEGNIQHLSKTGEIKKEWMSLALDLAKMIGMTNLAPVEQTYLTDFKVVPTKN